MVVAAEGPVRVVVVDWWVCNGNSSAGECILKLLGKRVA